MCSLLKAGNVHLSNNSWGLFSNLFSPNFVYLIFLLDQKQMLGCGAHVRKIALPHVRCACGSACGKVFETVCAMCVRVAHFGRAMYNRTFAHFFELLKLIL